MLIEAAKCSCSPALLSSVCQLGPAPVRAHDVPAAPSLTTGRSHLSTTWEGAARATPQAEGEGGGTMGGADSSTSAGARHGARNSTAGRRGSDVTTKESDANAGAAAGARAVVAVGRPAVSGPKLARTVDRPMHSHTSLRSITPPRNSRILISQPPMRI